MRRLTLCVPYYLNKGMLERQFRQMETLPREIRDQLGMIVVDDGSPRDPAEGRDIGLPLSIYRIGVDIRWNQDAARNIALHHCRTQWALMTDIDHLVPEATWYDVLQRLKLNKEYVYRFSRMTLDSDDPPSLSPYKPHPNSWLMTRAMYNFIGGMDERFAGHYGTDAEFRDRIGRRARNVIMLPCFLWRVPRTTIADASTTTLTRKGDPIDAGAISRIKLQRESETGWTPKRLSFPYAPVGHWSR